MAANRASTIEEWENFFEELLRLMTDYEAFYDSTDLRLRENIVIRMESALLALQQRSHFVFNIDKEKGN